MARFAEGATVEADLACIAIGIAAEDKLAGEAGLACDDGVLTDGCGRTSDPAVFAIGDVARLTHDGLRRSLRLESWHNANAQAELAARAILGQTASYDEMPWFWSDQFDQNVQLIGDFSQYDERLQVATSSSGTRVSLYLSRGAVVGAVGVNAGRDIRLIKRSLDARQPLPAGMMENAGRMAAGA